MTVLSLLVMCQSLSQSAACFSRRKVCVDVLSYDLSIIAKDFLLATEVQDIFRLSGSSERIKNLELSFDSPPRYGKGLDWTGYNVNDVANLLLRYLLQLPEPVIPLKFCKEFQEPLRRFQQDPSPSSGREVFDKIVKTYQLLITRLPDHSRLLLLYILDLLAVLLPSRTKTE